MLLAKLREKGLKLTPQRQLIVEILAKDPNHPSAHAILQKARERAPRMSFSTVYYTLNLFKKHKLIRELEFYDMENRYEGNLTNHINLICLKCRCIQDFREGLAIPAGEVEAETGFRTEDMRIEYYGYCKKCAEESG